MATVTLRLTPQRAHVRTARLVAAAMARRSGVPEELIEEVRLAVGEAFSRAVHLHERHGMTEPVVLTLVDDDRFEVALSDPAPSALPAGAGSVGDPAARRPAGRELRDGGRNGTRAGLTATPDWDTLDWDAPDWDPPNWEVRLDAGLGLALLDALVEDITVQTDGEAGTRITMSWPVDRPTAKVTPRPDPGQPPTTTPTTPTPRA